MNAVLTGGLCKEQNMGDSIYNYLEVFFFSIKLEKMQLYAAYLSFSASSRVQVPLLDRTFGDPFLSRSTAFRMTKTSLENFFKQKKMGRIDKHVWTRG